MVLNFLTLALMVVQPSVSIDLPAQTLEHAVQQLSTATGVSLSVSRQMANEVVVMNVKEVSSDDLLAKIAKATGGVWTAVSGGQRLDPSPEVERAEKAEALAQRIAELKAEIDGLSAEYKKNTKFDPETYRKEMDTMRQQAEQVIQNGVTNGNNVRQGMRQIGAAMAKTPGGRAIVQSLTAVRTEDLAKVGPGQRVVFTSSPTQMQKPLGATSLSVMRNFLQEQAAMAASIPAQDQARGQRRGNQDAEPRVPAATNPRNPQNASQPSMDMTPAKSFLIVTRFGAADSLNLQYIVANSQGAILGSGNLVLGMDSFIGAAETPKAEPDEKAVQFTETAKAAAKAFATGGRGMGQMMFAAGRGGGDFVVSTTGSPLDVAQPKPGADLVKFLVDPVANEPLSLYVSDAMGAVVKDTNLIALIPDSALNAVAQVVNTNRTPSQLEHALVNDWGMKVEAAEGWTLVTPKRFIDARASRVDRAALKSLIDAVLKKGAARLDDVASYTTKSPSLGTGGLDTAVMRILDPAAVQSLSQVYGVNRDMLMLWASMGPTTRNNLISGKTYQVSTIGTNGTSLLADMVYNSIDGPQVTLSDQTQAQAQQVQGGVPYLSGIPVINAQFTERVVLLQDVPMPQQSVRAPGGQGGPGGRGPGGRGMGGNMMTERTEVLPNGVSGSSVVALRSNSEAIAKGIVNDTNTTRVMTARTMAADKAFSEMPNGQGGNRRGPNQGNIVWSGYVPGQRTTYQFLFTMTPNITLSRSLEDTSFDPGAKAVAFNDLPASFMAQYTEAYKLMKERTSQMAERMQQGGAPGGRRGGQRPPP